MTTNFSAPGTLEWKLVFTSKESANYLTLLAAKLAAPTSMVRSSSDKYKHFVWIPPGTDPTFSWRDLAFGDCHLCHVAHTWKRRILLVSRYHHLAAELLLFVYCARIIRNTPCNNNNSPLKVGGARNWELSDDNQDEQSTDSPKTIDSLTTSTIITAKKASSVSTCFDSRPKMRSTGDAMRWANNTLVRWGW